jgi:acyl-coenzyme A synthetase/AMP-(fatty) acid ligase
MKSKYGFNSKPVVAIVSENHPYVLAIMLATWKLGNDLAPLDHNVPKDIVEDIVEHWHRLYSRSFSPRAMFKKLLKVNLYLPSFN